MTGAELEKKLEDAKYKDFVYESARLLTALFATFLSHGFTEDQLKAICAKLIDEWTPLALGDD